MDALLRTTIRGLVAVALLVTAGGCASLKDRFLAPSPAAPQPQLAASAVAPAGSTAKAAGAPAAPQSAVASQAKPAPVVVPPVLNTSDGTRSPYRLRASDPVLIYLRGIMPDDKQIEEIVDERGYVTLPYIEDVMAMGLTVSELEREIQRIYIEREIYKSVSVNVVMPSQTFFVQGEVRQPSRYQLVTGMTVLQAIATAGGYTEYADPKRVTMTRGGKVRELNMREIERNPHKDMSIESGDVIRVPRSIF